ncbi:MAG: D-2-hydroxyacid dehydrogenase [Campylobacter sp.]|nr:D-2-hydroxyacid dehydrogenase [Campylobacter sp.]
MKIVCLDAATLGDSDLSIFSKFGEFVSYDMTAPSECIARLKDADIVITNKVLITKEIMDATKLKLICVSATGMNNIDLDYAKLKNISVKNVASYSTNNVVEHTFALLFATLKRLNFYVDYVKNGEWVKSEIFTNVSQSIDELNGKNFGVIGLGEIGQKVAFIAQIFGAKVCYYSTSGANFNPNFTSTSLENLLKTCDIVSIHAPLNEKTKNLITKKELEMMKKSSILLNLGRGGIVDENALAWAIDNKDMRVCLDVLECEPMRENHPLLNVKNQENLLITPHIAWASKEARTTLVERISQNIKEFLGG